MIDLIAKVEKIPEENLSRMRSIIAGQSAPTGGAVANFRFFPKSFYLLTIRERHELAHLHNCWGARREKGFYLLSWTIQSNSRSTGVIAQRRPARKRSNQATILAKCVGCCESLRSTTN
jgi:hypothetical protein